MEGEGGDCLGEEGGSCFGAVCCPDARISVRDNATLSRLRIGAP